MNISNNDKQNYPLCRLKFVVEKYFTDYLYIYNTIQIKWKSKKFLS